MTKTRSISQVLVMALVLITGCFYAKHAAAQNGACIVNVTSVSIPCYGGCGKSGCSCKGSITINEPNGGYGSGILYGTMDAYCCTTKFSILANPDGACSTANIRLHVAKTAENSLVFVRGCDGRFRLYIVGQRKEAREG